MQPTLTHRKIMNPFRRSKQSSKQQGVVETEELQASIEKEGPPSDRSLSSSTCCTVSSSFSSRCSGEDEPIEGSLPSRLAIITQEQEEEDCDEIPDDTPPPPPLSTPDMAELTKTATPPSSAASGDKAHLENAAAIMATVSPDTVLVDLSKHDCPTTVMMECLPTSAAGDYDEEDSEEGNDCDDVDSVTSTDEYEVEQTTVDANDLYGYGDATPDSSAAKDLYGYGDGAPDSETTANDSCVLEQGQQQQQQQQYRYPHHHRTPRRSSLKGSSSSPERSGNNRFPRRRASIGACQVEVRLPGQREPVKRRRSITFHSDVAVRQVPPAAMLAGGRPDALWLQDEDFERINKKILHLLTRLETNNDDNNNTGDTSVCVNENGVVTIDGKKYCYRGLEKYLAPEIMEVKRHQALDSVLNEQFLQRQLGDYDDEVLANIYKYSTMRSQLEASKRAGHDAKEAEAILKSTRKRLNRRASM